MLGYITEFAWIPDDEFVNSLQGAEYYGVWLGSNDEKTLSLWAIEPIVESPTADLEDDILPEGYEAVELDDEINKYGFIRHSMPTEDIGTTVEYIEATVAELLAG